jgi:hypothetical protein
VITVPLKIKNGLGKIGSFRRLKWLIIEMVAEVNITLIVKRLVSVSTQDTVYSRQIPRYLEPYIPVYTYRYVGTYLSRSYRLYP